MLIKAIKKRLFRRYAINLLEKSEPEKIENLSKKKLLPSFKRAAENVPAYKKILHEKNIKAEQINSIEDFAEKVPILKKEDLFPKFKLK
jgi:phenylacetate-coenzyme A ligase PaaK-like adenylate-forming protein